MKTMEKKTNTILTKRSDKKNVNIKWNSTRYFLIGLAFTLGVVTLIMEMRFSVDKPAGMAINDFTPTEISHYDFTIEKLVVAPPKQTVTKETPIKKTTKIIDVIKEVPDTKTKVVETPTTPVDTSDPVVTTTTEAPTPKVEAPPVERSVLNVEFVPVYPGCEKAGSNAAKIACMSEKMNKFIARKFDSGGLDYLESGSMQRITVMFKIDTNGNIVDVVARAVDKNLEKEAKRVVSKFPTLTPAKQGNQAVKVGYTIPITFRVDN